LNPSNPSSPSNPLARLAAEATVSALRARLEALLNHVVDEAITIQQIPAPTFDEGCRAAYVRGRFRGLDSVEVDALHNVTGRLPGADCRRPAVLVAAHLDTVFDAGTPLAIRRQEDRIYGPGLGDNSLGLAGLLALMDVLRNGCWPADIWFAANSREEGLGDLGGIRAVYEKLAPRLGCAVIVEGLAFGRIYHAGIAVRRLAITCHAPGGHSWLNFGRPSAIHGLVRLGATITTLEPPQAPRTTYNIGLIEGGRSVNSIAADASMLIDLRSESREALAALESQVMGLVDAQRGPDLDFEVRVVGDRPVGGIPVSHPLVQMAGYALDLVGVQPSYETGSTDANVPLAAGLPAVTVGVTRGGNAHRLDEYIETAPIADGLWQLLLLIVGAASGLAGKS
jgi:acetylornithine deacetylase/succinyl-diaminopimelate desuccinylase-like protein